MKRALGPLERQLFAYSQMRGKRALRTRDLTAALGISSKQERELLNRLAKADLIAQVQRGLYLVPARLPLGGKWSPDEGLVLNTLMEHLEGRYQICGPNAFNRYGYDNQMPTRVYAYNNRVSRQMTVGAVDLTLIKVATDRLGDTENVPMADGLSATYSSRARTLLDAVYDWSRFNSLPRAFDWIRSDLESGRVDEAELTRVTVRFGDVGTIRRIGALLDRERAAEPTLIALERTLMPTSSFIPWNPQRPKRGTIDRRWGVVWNDPT